MSDASNLRAYAGHVLAVDPPAPARSVVLPPGVRGESDLTRGVVIDSALENPLEDRAAVHRGDVIHFCCAKRIGDHYVVAQSSIVAVEPEVGQ